MWPRGPLYFTVTATAGSVVNMMNGREKYWCLACCTAPDNVQQPSTYEKPKAASAVLGS